MKSLLVCGCWWLAWIGAISAEDALPAYKGCVLVPTEWADGDSFRVRFPDGKEHTIRLYGADCVESHINTESDARRLREQRRYFGIAGGAVDVSISEARALGKRADMRTRELLAKPFTVFTAFSDGRGDARFQRVYGFVETSDGRDLASVLVQEGLARAFGVSRRGPRGISAQDYRDGLRDLELVAAAERRGAWAKTDWRSLPDIRNTQRIEDAEQAVALGQVVPADGVDLNTASRDELMTLPGVGEVISLRIIEGRESGPYKKADDLQRVSGLGKSAIEAMRPALRFANSTVPPTSTKKP